INEKSEALYFSRELIPAGGRRYKKHIGIYVWQRAALEEFFKTRPTSLEKAEKLEQLRVLETGGRIKMAESVKDSPSIDTPADLQEAQRYLNDKK
ncbi:MAG: 3-deoxy-manno-octulosonate cytidylyltransferase, partial [Elusimicrobiota bacterium]|nr:3-deoxy-manno-octulosonate cytidylyltransferase [Elusimicrobiota bacterium]